METVITMHPVQRQIFQKMSPERKLETGLMLYYSARELLQEEWQHAFVEVSRSRIFLCGSFGLSFKLIPFFAFSTHLPDNALGTKFTVRAGVGAGLAVFKAFLAVADHHLLTLHMGRPAGMKFAVHGTISPGFIASQRVRVRCSIKGLRLNSGCIG